VDGKHWVWMKVQSKMELEERSPSPCFIWAWLLEHVPFENERNNKEEKMARQMKAKLNEDKS